MSGPRIFKDDDEQIGFAVDALLSSAITLDEFKNWCTDLIAKYPLEVLPAYLFELLDFNEPLFHIYRTIGFVPGWGASDDESFALKGVAALRSRGNFEVESDRELALDKLKENQRVMQIFRREFPGISL